MRAAFYDILGEANAVLKVGEVPTPTPADGEVRVKLKTSGVNPSDSKARQNGRGGILPFPLIIPHSDGAGVIDKVGRGVKKDRVGKRVWLMNGQWGRPCGTAAEYICIESKFVIDLPESVNMHEAACFGIPFMTAHRAVMFDGPILGQTILVQGGAGAVGHYAIQVAKFNGARVITTVSSDEKADTVYKVGADEIINYKIENILERIKAVTDGRGVNRIIELDIATNGPTYSSILAEHGTVILYGTSDVMANFAAADFFFKWATLKGFIIYTINDAQRDESVSALNVMIEKGALQTTISSQHALEDIVSAHQIVENSQQIGNVVINISK